MPGKITRLTCSWGNKYRNLTLRTVESFKIEIIKYDHEFHGTRPEKDCASEAQQKK
jgi:hypothetical protein